MYYSISHLCKRYKLSRSTLLYYDQIGLLKASGRSSSNYRKYSAEDIKRLEQICIYKQIGLPLQEIKRILDASESTVKEVLEQRLYELNQEISILREQQRVIIGILKNEKLLKHLLFIDRDTLVEMLTSAGFDEMGMCKLHAELEHLSPEGHQEFLQSLGISDEEIRQIRQHSNDLYKKDKTKTVK